nr:hypothetical protein [Tanacetum cinerariifolium]
MVISYRYVTCHAIILSCSSGSNYLKKKSILYPCAPTEDMKLLAYTLEPPKQIGTAYVVGVWLICLCLVAERLKID